MKNNNQVWEDLIFSILAVYNCSLETAFKHKEALEKQGLLDVQNLAKLDSNEIVVKLSQSWPERGGLNNIFADRLESLGQFISKKDLKSIEKILKSTNKSEIRAELIPIKGIGEKVLSNYFELREIK